MGATVIDLEDVKRKKKLFIKNTTKIDKNIEDITTVFGKKHRRIRKVLKQSPEIASVMMLKGLLSMTLDILPLAEATYRKYKSERAGYALVALSNQARELANDLRALNESGKVVEKMLKRVLEPNLALVAQNTAAEINNLKREIYSRLKTPKKRKRIMDMLDNHLRGQLDYLREVRNASEDQLNKLFDVKD